MLGASRSETWAMFGTLLLMAALALPLACGDDDTDPSGGDECAKIGCDGLGYIGGRGGNGGKGGAGGTPVIRDGAPRSIDGARRPQAGTGGHPDDAGADDAGPDSGN